MMLSKKKAMAFFREHALPRRIRDEEAEKAYQREFNVNPSAPIYRRVGPDEADRGELYPLLHDGISTFAHFGIGVGVYFTQLALLTGAAFVGGMIMLTGAYEYEKSDFGSGPHLPFTALCEYENVTAVLGCDGDVTAEMIAAYDADSSTTTCSALYRPHCSLQQRTVIADLCMCLLFVLLLFAFKFYEERIATRLDESVQTAQDYSVEVLDPDSDADDPDEWKSFFAQFGDVRYVTILRSNSKLTRLLLRKHLYTQRLQDLGESSSMATVTTTASQPLQGRLAHAAHIAHLHKRFDEIEAALQRALDPQRRVYPVSRVIVTFERESSQRACRDALQQPFLHAALDTSLHMPAQHRFRGKNVLKISEPAEPDNTLWHNLEIDKRHTLQQRVVSALISLAILVSLWFLLLRLKEISSLFLSVMIGVVDALLPTVLSALSDMTFPTNETKRQSRLQTRLYAARILVSTLLPYAQTPWDAFLSYAFLQQVLITQLSACFFSAAFALVDLDGLLDRHVYGPLFSSTQEELNARYMGTQWSLAEKYTGVAKVMCISLFYSLLTPISLLVATLSFAAMFAIDNFLLLRRYRAVSMLDASISTRLRQQAIVAVAVKMIITLRLVYSWPMDEVMLVTSSAGNATASSFFVRVDKAPPLLPHARTRPLWQSDSEHHVMFAYSVGVYLVIAMALYNSVLEPLSVVLRRWLCNAFEDESSGGERDIAFSDIDNAAIYYPVLRDPPAHVVLFDQFLSLQRVFSFFSFASCEEEKEKESENDAGPVAALSDLLALADKRFLCSYTKNVLAEHRPVLVDNLGGAESGEGGANAKSALVNRARLGKDDISVYVPVQRQRHVLSVVQGYAVSPSPSHALSGERVHAKGRGRGKVLAAAQRDPLGGGVVRPAPLSIDDPQADTSMSLSLMWWFPDWRSSLFLSSRADRYASRDNDEEKARENNPRNSSTPLSRFSRNIAQYVSTALRTPTRLSSPSRTLSPRRRVKPRVAGVIPSSALPQTVFGFAPNETRVAPGVDSPSPSDSELVTD